MAYVETEIASQPQCWRRAIDIAAREATTSALPRAGERVAVVGCGTSLYMAQAYASLRESSGAGETDAFAASQFPSRRRYDRLLALTRSGTTTEVLTLLGAVRGSVPTVAITADPTTQVTEVADQIVALEFADETSVVQTRFATTALTLLRAHLGQDLTRALDDVRTALAEPVPAQLLDCQQFTFLGQDWTTGLAAEAALKLREAALAWSEAYPAMEYRHGPISVTTTGTATWMLGDAPDSLAGEVRATGAQWVHAPHRDPLAELVRIQRLAVALAERRGLDPDHPRHLTRSVILTTD